MRPAASRAEQGRPCAPANDRTPSPSAERQRRPRGKLTPLVVCVVVFALVSSSQPASARQVGDNPHGPFPPGSDCADCHSAEAWSPVLPELAFVHGERSGSRLTGAHEEITCAACHLDLRFDEPRVPIGDCANCHVDVHENRLDETCITCHGTSTFRDVDGDGIHARTSFPLTGSHRQVDCESCHIDDTGGSFAARDTECLSCHLPEYERAETVDHVEGGYPTDCAECHNAIAWSDAPRFDHVSAANGFALVGAHTRLRCASCHRVPDLDVIHPASDGNDCIACHQEDYDDEHGGTDTPSTCLACHNQNDWDDADFDHSTTAFPLVGAHARQDCEACHGEPQRLAARFVGPEQCIVCHQADYDDEHAGTGTPTTCLDCHDQNDWDSDSWDAPSLTHPMVHSRAPSSWQIAPWTSSSASPSASTQESGA